MLLVLGSKCYNNGVMNLHEYLSQPGAPSISEIRERMAALGYDVKSDAQIRQWCHKYGGRLPSPENCVGLKKATDGAVPRQSFHPNDWQKIWPELATPTREAEHE